jgi:hypothetical protein
VENLATDVRDYVPTVAPEEENIPEETNSPVGDKALAFFAQIFIMGGDAGVLNIRSALRLASTHVTG